MEDARPILTRPPKIIDCSPGFSFYKYAQNSIEKRGKRLLPLRRFFSLARKLGAVRAVEERLQRHRDFRGEDRSLQAFFGAPVSSSALRISVFAEPFETIGDLCKEHERIQEGYLGYVVVKETKVGGGGRVLRSVFESVLRMPPVTNNYMHSFSLFRGRVGCDALFEVRGSYFTQQDGSGATTCGHAALCNLLNNMLTRVRRAKPVTRVVTKARINRILKRKPKSNWPPERLGLNSRECVRVLQHFGLPAVTENYVEHPDLDYRRFVHSILEAGYGVILGFRAMAGGHALAIIGHTFNSDMYAAEAEFAYFHPPGVFAYHNAFSYVDHWIVQDDNFGPYYCAGTDLFRRITLPSYDPVQRPMFAVGILPRRSSRGALNAEAYASMQLAWLLEAIGNRGPRWYRKLWAAARVKVPLTGPRRRPRQWLAKEPVLRTFMGRRREYIDALREARDWEGRSFSPATLALLEGILPDRFWLTEVSLPDLYATNKRKLADIIEDWRVPKRKGALWEGFIAARLPGQLVLTQQRIRIPCRVEGHIRLLRAKRSHNPDQLEW